MTGELETARAATDHRGAAPRAGWAAQAGGPALYWRDKALSLQHARGELYGMTINLPQLESHLWEAANILRGPVDAADFKTYVCCAI